MNTKHKSWMPLWLATYIFIMGTVAMCWFTGMSTVMLATNDVPFIWYYWYMMAAILSTLWMWYFMYLGTRYFDKIPRICYLFGTLPFWNVIATDLPTTLAYRHFSNGVTYFYYIDFAYVFFAVILLFIGYELYTNRKEYVQQLKRAMSP